MTDNLKHFALDAEYELIVETNTHYQPDLGREAHFAGIWPLEGQGPAAKKWIAADSPAQAFTQARDWATEMLPEVHRRQHPWNWESSHSSQATLTRPGETVTVYLRPFEQRSDDANDTNWVIFRPDMTTGGTRVLHCTGIDQVEPTLARDEMMTGHERKQRKDKEIAEREAKEGEYLRNAADQIQKMTGTPVAA